MKKKILVISWFYPPINSSEGLVTFKLINNSKYDYDVFTQGSVEDWTYGSNVTYKNNDNVNVISSNATYIPFWISECVEYFKQNRDKYDAIMTRAMPQECHLAGIKIKKLFPDVKWIASFGDPIDKNPYHHIACKLFSINSLKNFINRDKGFKFKISPKRIALNAAWEFKHKWERKLRAQLKYIQENTIKMADKIVLNNESQKRYMIGDNKANLAKTVVVHHSYDKSFYEDIKKKENEKIRFLFVGHLDEIRNVTPILMAINDLKADYPDLAEKVEFVFYGNMSAADKLYIIDNALYDVVKKEKAIDYQQSLSEMQQADWLIHTDGNIGSIVNENIFFAAKIVDYFGSGTNIFATTMQTGDVIDVLNNANALVSSYSYNEIKNWLYLIIYQGFKKEPNHEYIEKEFSSVNVAKVFDASVDEMFKNK